MNGTEKEDQRLPAVKQTFLGSIHCPNAKTLVKEILYDQTYMPDFPLS